MKRPPRPMTIQQSNHHPVTNADVESLVQDSIIGKRPPLKLVLKLCQEFEEAGISYCHWKSNNALDRSANGENDLDLLVSREDASRFTEILFRLGFKQATAPEEKRMPGVMDYYGYDDEADKLIHVHAHYQLILGHDMTKNYRLSIERAYLESTVQDDLFKVPAPEFEFIVLVIRMVLKHSTWDVILGREGALKASEEQELSYLQLRINRKRVDEILKLHLPYIDTELFDSCVRALQPACPSWTRFRTGQRLQSRLQTNTRRPLYLDTFLKIWRRIALALQRRIFKYSPKYKLGSGGAMIAIVGGDGAGKSTAVDGLHRWLSKNFQVRSEHLGKPAWSLTTIAVRTALKIGQILRLYPLETTFRETINQKSVVSPGYPWLIREVCRARDRYRVYLKARRFANNGGIVILDRFPVPQIKIMDALLTRQFIHQLMEGPRADQFLSPRQDAHFAKALVGREEMYYRQIASPDLLVVLRVHPDIAAQRKTDEDPDYVRERSKAIWELDWESIDAKIVDGSKSETSVLSELKSMIWSRL